MPKEPNTNPKTYLGDAVYAEWDGFYLVLTTSDGISNTNTIYLDPGAYSNLISFGTIHLLPYLVAASGQETEEQ